MQRQPVATLDQIAQELGAELELGDHGTGRLGHDQRRPLMTVGAERREARELDLGQLA